MTREEATMTLDEAIKRSEEVAEKNSKLAERIRDNMTSEIARSIADKCETCADEHRQLAEWLKDYKRLLEQESVLDKITCDYFIVDKIEEIINKYKARMEAERGENEQIH